MTRAHWMTTVVRWSNSIESSKIELDREARYERVTVLHALEHFDVLLMILLMLAMATKHPSRFVSIT